MIGSEGKRREPFSMLRRHQINLVELMEVVEGRRFAVFSGMGMILGVRHDLWQWERPRLSKAAL